MAADPLGVYSLPHGAFLLSGKSSDFHSIGGSWTGMPGTPFAHHAESVMYQLAPLPGGNSLVATGICEAQEVNSSGQLVAGTLVGVPSCIAALATDSAGNATAVDSESTSVKYSLRSSGASKFVLQSAIAEEPPEIRLVGLAVDPNGAAVVTWLDGAKLKQATRAAGSSSFAAPSVISESVSTSISAPVAEMASNKAGRAVILFKTAAHSYEAAVREPAGAFGAPAKLTGALTSVFSPGAVAVSEDGTAAALVGSENEVEGGDFYSLEAFGLASNSTAWSSLGSYGGKPGNSDAYPVLAGGPGSLIDAAWSIDRRSLAEVKNGKVDHYEVVAGKLGATPTSVLKVTDPPLGEHSGEYGYVYTGYGLLKLALNSCGGALLIGLGNDGGLDGLLASSQSSGACSAGVAGHVTISSGPTLHVLGARTVVALRCAGGAGCHLKVLLTSSPLGRAAGLAKVRKVVVGTASVSIAAGRLAKVSITLTRAGRNLLAAHRGRIGVRLTVTGSAGTASVHQTKTDTLVRAKHL